MEERIIDFMRHIRGKDASTTYHRKLWQIRSFAKHMAVKGKKPAEVIRADVEAFLSGLRCTQRFRQAVCAVVREFYEFLRVHAPAHYPAENPAAGIAFKPDRSLRLPQVPSQGAVDALLARLYEQEGDLHLRDRLIAELAYGSGLRRSELVRLNIEDIDLDAGTARVLGKGSKLRIVPLTGKALEALRELLVRRHAARGPLLQSAFGRRLGVAGLYYVMRSRVGLRPHLMRHACATHLLKNGCGIRLIQELLGHERLGTTYIYTSVDREQLRAVVGQAHPRKKGGPPVKIL